MASAPIPMASLMISKKRIRFKAPPVGPQRPDEDIPAETTMPTNPTEEDKQKVRKKNQQDSMGGGKY